MWIAIAAVVALCIGYSIGHTHEARYWAMKSDERRRSAVHHRGCFYYVVPESEYIQMRLRTHIKEE